MFDLTEVGFVLRIEVGKKDLADPNAADDPQKSIELLNCCLAGSPRGKIIGMEKNSSVQDTGNKKIITRHLTYHVGFPRKPHWLNS